MDAFALLDNSRGGGYGHMGVMVGNKDMGYYFFTQGPVVEGQLISGEMQLALPGQAAQGAAVYWRDTPPVALMAGRQNGGYSYGSILPIATSGDADLSMVIKGLTAGQEGLLTGNAADYLKVSKPVGIDFLRAFAEKLWFAV